MAEQKHTDGWIDSRGVKSSGVVEMIAGHKINSFHPDQWQYNEHGEMFSFPNNEYLAMGAEGVESYRWKD